MLRFPKENEQEFVKCWKKRAFPTEQLHIIHQSSLVQIELHCCSQVWGRKRLYLFIYLKLINYIIPQECIKWSDQQYHTFKMLQKISVSNKCCSFERSIHQWKKNYRGLKKKKIQISVKSAYKNDFWRILKIQLCITGINYILKYIQIENSRFKL